MDGDNDDDDDDYDEDGDAALVNPWCVCVYIFAR